MIRERLYLGAQKRPGVFKGIVKPMGKIWTTVYSRDLLTAAEGSKMELEQKGEALKAAWQAFLKEDLPAIEKAVIEISQT
jgi:hypothetical protein